MLFSYFLDSMIIGLTLLPSVFTAASLEQQVLSLHDICASVVVFGTRKGGLRERREIY